MADHTSAPGEGKPLVSRLALSGVASAAAMGSGGKKAGLVILRCFERQPHEKLRSVRTGAEVDFPLMSFDDDPMTDHQAESRP
jgi:hypothetical protein